MNNNDMSFLPEDYVEKQIEQRTNLICISLFAVVLIGIIGAYVVTTRHRAEVRQERTKVNNAYADAARRLEQLEELQQSKQQMMRKAQLTATLLEPVPRSFLLADLINRMPSTLSVLEFGLKTKTERRRARVKLNKTALANAQNDKSTTPE
ncbi:MAG: hypothetical protein OER86_05060, partial [Phycisphaerae bacterium]|nr:hypothetical protein [Phycisphaerae bacterium]